MIFDQAQLRLPSFNRFVSASSLLDPFLFSFLQFVPLCFLFALSLSAFFAFRTLSSFHILLDNLIVKLYIPVSQTQVTSNLISLYLRLLYK